MGMTDKQFAAYVRQLMWRIKETQELLEKGDAEKTKEELSGILEDLQKSLED